jgi:hypothetical protein
LDSNAAMAANAQQVAVAPWDLTGVVKSLPLMLRQSKVAAKDGVPYAISRLVMKPAAKRMVAELLVKAKGHAVLRTPPF